MERRAFLGIAAFTLTAATGCLVGESEDGGAELLEPDAVTLVDARYTTHSMPNFPKTSTRQPPYAVVDFLHEANAVRIEGYDAITDCEAVHLDEIAYDPDEDAVVFDVVTFTEPDDCVGSEVTVWYEAVANFSEGVPSSVAVRHDGETVPHCLKPTPNSRCRVV